MAETLKHVGTAIVDGIRWDTGTGVVVAEKPAFVPPFCGGGEREGGYNPLDDCNVTNRIYGLSLSYARARGNKLPSAEDMARALKQILPERT